ncbi:hypothetical protein [Caldimonas aquatica]|uniref:UDP-N-acetylmuramate--alanine ligase n=1 Tax=Caldimonas aquatica TaxID=376175 RepID=A0ABY6MQY2_9BURK|nr:hypothetical protein [Schlegelella aquatica]UZD54421.1 hypothetical protein OMP39_12210 [Schlegelella aquatica]
MAAPTQLTVEIASAAARLIVEEGMEYGPAKRKAAKLVAKKGLAASELPGNDLIEDEVRAYISIFCAETQPGELAALRAVALRWMERLAEFDPHLTGAVWNGTATRLNDVWINLFCDDPKSAEILLIDKGVDYDVRSVIGFRGEPVDVLTLTDRSPELGERVLVHLVVYDRDDLRGALKPDARGRAERGNTQAVRALLEPTG